MKRPTFPVRGNIFPVKELSLSLVREDQLPVRVATKPGKKRQSESNDQKKTKKMRSSKGVYNQYAS